MRTDGGANALFYIGSASPKAVKETMKLFESCPAGQKAEKKSEKRLVLSTDMPLFLRKPLVGKLLGMRANGKTSRHGRRDFEVVKHRHSWDFDIESHGQRTHCRGSFSVFDFYLMEPEFSKAKKKNEARLE